MLRQISKCYNGKQNGSVLVESLFVMPLFFCLIFGIFEYSYLYRTKATLNLATFEAVRAGTLHNAKLQPMKDALAMGMIPHFMQGKSTIAQYAIAYGAAEVFIRELDMVGDPVQIISPTKSVFNAFKKKLYVTLVGGVENEQYVIPNDNLPWRPATETTVSSNNKRIKINIQDANLLKIKTSWCHKLLVPGLDRIAYETILKHSRTNEQRVCNQLGIIRRAVGIRGYYVAITSHGILRMQSPVFYDRNEQNLR